jgi:hypothetical protein
LVLIRNSELRTEMSPASRAPLINYAHDSQGSKSLALGLATSAATQLDEFVLTPIFWKRRSGTDWLTRSLSLPVLTSFRRYALSDWVRLVKSRILKVF